MQININVNGTDHSLDVEPRRLLVDAIRSRPGPARHPHRL